MKKQALKKDFYMEIKKSKNRFISIFFIVAMGVAFYSGIQSSAPDMRETGDAYFDESELMDLKVVGTMGLTAEDQEALSSLEGIRRAEAGYMTDVLCQAGGEEGSQKVLHVESLPTDMNRVTLSGGEMPEGERECLMDAAFAEIYRYQVGDKVKISQDAGEEDPVLKTEEFTIAGLGSSPLYISFGRGSTTLGTGEVAGFLYVPKEAFSMDVYTQIYLQAEGAREEMAYTDPYEDLTDAVRKRVEGIEDVRCKARYEEIRAEADEKLSDARKELEEGRKEADEKLADARREIEDGEKKLQDGKEELENGRKKLEDARAELDSKEKELKDARAKLADGFAKLNAGKQELAGKEAEYQEKADQAEKTIASGEKALADGKKKLNKGQKEYEQGKKAYESGEAEYKKSLEEYEKNLKACESGDAQYQQGEAAYASGLKAYQTQKAQYDQAIAAGMPADAAEMLAAKQALDTAKQELVANRAVLDATKQQLNQAQQQLNAGKPMLESAKQELAANKKKLDSAGKELEKSAAAIKEKEAELQAGKKELEDGKKAIAAAKSEIASREAALVSAQQQADSGAAQIADGRKTISQKEQELKDGEKEIAENEQKLADAREEYEDGEKEAREKIADGQKKIEDAEKEIADIKMPEWYVTDRTSLTEYSGYGENADRMKNIGEVFPVLFFLVAALISLTTMTRMVEEERTQIGTLKALGYNKFSIASKYINYALLATIGGSMFGVLIGEKILPFIIIHAYGIMYHNMTDIKLPYNMDFALLATGAAVLCTMAATVSACYRELAATPANLMRPPAPKQGKRVLLERVAFLWNRLSFTWKSTIRNLFRYKKRFFMTIFGIGGCMALLLVGYGLQDSIMNIAVLQYQEIQKYDSLVVMKEDADKEQVQELESVLAAEEKVKGLTEIYMKKLDLYAGNKELNVYLMVPQNPEVFSDYVEFRDRKSGTPYQLGDAGVILSEKTANMLDTGQGGVLNLGQAGESKKEVPVAEVCENYLSHYVYMTPALYEETYGKAPEYNTLVVGMQDGVTQAEIEKTGEQALSFEAALSISYTGSLMGQLDDMLGSLDIVIVVLIISAGMLAFVVLYNLNNININERKRELATLKVLGFYDMEVGTYVYRENILLTLLGALLGAGLGVILHRFVIETVEVDICMFGRNIDPSSFVYSILFTIGFSAVVNFVMFFKLRKIDMVESLKSVE